MATWNRILTSADLVPYRTSTTSLYGAPKRGLLDNGLTFLRSGNFTRADSNGTLQLEPGHIENYLPSIQFSSSIYTSTAQRIQLYSQGVDGNGSDTSTAHFHAHGTLLDAQNSEHEDHMLDHYLGSVIAVPTGHPSHKKHTFDISGLIGNHNDTNDTNDTRLHFSLWRAYVSNTYTWGDGEDSGGLIFRMVKRQLTINGSPSYAPDNADSLRHYTFDSVTVPLDEDECLQGNMCYYLLGVHPSSEDEADDPSNDGKYWPDEVGTGAGSDTRQVSFKINVEATHRPWEAQV